MYQLSVAPPPTVTSTPGSGEKEVSSDKAKASVLSQRLGIDPMDLVSLATERPPDHHITFSPEYLAT